MNQEVKERWVEALLSGRYTQAQGYLRTMAGGYCCLGVLCDLYQKATGLGEWDTGYGGFVDGEGDRSRTHPPGDVQRWAGITASVSAGDRTLTSLNDSGVSFLMIADLIRSEL